MSAERIIKNKNYLSKENIESILNFGENETFFNVKSQSHFDIIQKKIINLNKNLKLIEEKINRLKK